MSEYSFYVDPIKNPAFADLNMFSLILDQACLNERGLWALVEVCTQSLSHQIIQ